MDSPLTAIIARYEGTSSGLFRDFNGKLCLTFVVIVTQATVKFEREILRLSGRGLDYHAETQGTCKHCVSVIGHYNTNKCLQGISNSPRYAFQSIICPFLIRFAKHQDDKRWCMSDKKVLIILHQIKGMSLSSIKLCLPSRPKHGDSPLLCVPDSAFWAATSASQQHPMRMHSVWSVESSPHCIRRSCELHCGLGKPMVCSNSLVRPGASWRLKIKIACTVKSLI